MKKGRKTPISLHKGGTLISLKYQKVEGTAEEKIPYECYKLQDAIDTYGYDSAIIVLIGLSPCRVTDFYVVHIVFHTYQIHH